MGKLDINGELDINSYLTAATTLYLSSAANTSVVIRNNTTAFINMNSTSSSDRTSTGNINALRIYGTAYGNDANYLATAGQLSIGDPGPQIIFNTSSKLTEGQPLALIYSSHDTIASGNSLSLVSSETNCSFIAPTIKALTKFVGTLDGNAATATTLSATLAVNKGGTGRTTLTSGYALIGNGTSAVSLRALTNNTTVGASGWSSTTGPYLITHNTLAYWNGAYSGTSSNLAYCSKGAFGSIITQSKSGLEISNYITIGSALGQQNSGRAELSIISTTDIPMDLWMGTNATAQWSLSVRASSDSNVLSVYNTSGGHLLRIYTNGMIKLNKGTNQYGSSLPSGLGTGDKGCIFFKI